MTQAVRLLDSILLNTWLRDGRKNLGPGQVILNLSNNNRNILKNLRSEDLKNIRLDSIFGS